MTWKVLPSQLPPLQPSLPIEVAEEGGEESGDDVEAEVWLIAWRGVAHTLLRRDVAASGAGIDEVVSVDAGSVGQSPSVPSSPSEPSSPVNNSSDRAAPSVCFPAPETDGEGQGGQEAGEVEVGNPGGDESDDDVEAEVWPIVGRGVAHTLLRRDVTAMCLHFHNKFE